MVNLTKHRIIMADLINCKSQWSLSIVNLTKPWSSSWTFGFFDQMFNLLHGKKCHFSQMFQSKVIHVFHALNF
jgi:hypothetical protein